MTPHEFEILIKAGARGIRHRYDGRRVTHLSDFAEEVAEIVLRAVAAERGDDLPEQGN